MTPKTKVKSQAKKPKSKSVLKKSLAVVGIGSATALTGVLIKQNLELKKMISKLQEEVGFYRKRDIDKSSFSFFGKPKQSSIVELGSTAIKQNSELKKMLSKLEKEIEVYQKKENPEEIKKITSDFNLCNKKLDECNTAYIQLQKNLDMCNAAYAKLQKDIMADILTK